MRTLLALSLLSASALLSACNDSQPTVNTTPPAAILPTTLFSETEPADAQAIPAAKASAKEGDRVVIRGRIGGTIEPFVNGRAVMSVVDMQLPTCAEIPGDNCPTPWDYCCEPRETITANAATVQVSDENGGPLRADLKGISGLEPMAEIIVVGTVGQTTSPTAFLIHAEAIHVVK